MVHKAGTDINASLAEREKTHGSFSNHAKIETALRNIMEINAELSDLQHIGLGMILHKVARILNQGHNYIDSWHDIAGYATLVERGMSSE